MTAVQTLVAFYIGTVLINIAVAGAQYLAERNSVQRTLLFYWLGILASSFANEFAEPLSFKLALISSAGTFLTQIILGRLLAVVRGIEFRLLPYLALWLATALVGFVLIRSNIPFTTALIPMVASAVLPVFVISFRVIKSSTRPLTLVQKMFLFSALAMSVHYLDYPYFITRPELLVYAMGIAFALLHFISIVAAMMANESALQRKNDDLELEIHKRARQLSEAEHQLFESNKLATLGRMAGGVAHEINNPLSVISMNLESLRLRSEKKSLTHDDVVRETEAALRLVQRISKITDALRRVAREPKGVEKTDTSLLRIIEDSISCCDDRMRDLQIQLNRDFPDSECPIFCNPGEISQVILNLLHNAIDAVTAAPEKNIVLILREFPDRYEFSVEDSGFLSPDIAPRIMDPFFTTKPVGKGTGLGLSISKSIAETHGGKLYFDPHGSRTRFTLELPKPTRAEREIPESAPADEVR